MAVSHNGWPVIKSGLWALPAVSGSVKAGPVWVVFNWLAREYARRVEPIRRGESWGYAYREIRGSSTLWSNHASGTAVDFNAPSHPFRTRAEQNMTSAQIRTCEAIVLEARGVLKWLRGHDPMHWEIAAGGERVEDLATRILQRALGVTIDGVRGPKTLAALKAHQAAHGLVQDGQDGPKTWATLPATPSKEETPVSKHTHTIPGVSVDAVARAASIPADVTELTPEAFNQLLGWARDAQAVLTEVKDRALASDRTTGPAR